MVLLIIFYVLFVFYIVWIGQYLNRSLKFFCTENEELHNKQNLEYEMMDRVRHLMVLTIIILIISTILLSNIKEDAKILPMHIGICLSTAVVIFYFSFLFWNLQVPKVKKFFINKYNIELSKDALFGFYHYGMIISFSLLLLEVVVSIIITIFL